MELLHQIQLAIPDPSQRFVVRQDTPVCPMGYVKWETPFRWAPVRTSLGQGEVVINSAVCQSPDEKHCMWTDFHEAAGSNNVVACRPQSSGTYCCGTGTSCCSGPDLFHMGILAQAKTLPFTTIAPATSSATQATTTESSSTLSSSISATATAEVTTSPAGMAATSHAKLPGSRI